MGKTDKILTVALCIFAFSMLVYILIDSTHTVLCDKYYSDVPVKICVEFTSLYELKKIDELNYELEVKAFKERLRKGK